MDNTLNQYIDRYTQLFDLPKDYFKKQLNSSLPLSSEKISQQKEQIRKIIQDRAIKRAAELDTFQPINMSNLTEFNNLDKARHYAGLLTRVRQFNCKSRRRYKRKSKKSRRKSRKTAMRKSRRKSRKTSKKSRRRRS